MVQVSLRKAGRLICLLALAILVVTFLLLFTDVGRHGHSANVRKQPDPLDVEELHRWSPRCRLVTIEPARRAELKSICAEIAHSYSKGNVEELREWRRKLPELLEQVGEEDFKEISFPLFQVVAEELNTKLNRILANDTIGEEYRNVDDFGRHADALIAVALVYGDVLFRRRDFGTFFNNIEPFMFYRLKSYRNNFHIAGRADMEKAADRAISNWIDQIESKDGYTRAQLVHWIVRSRVWADVMMEQNGKTWENISQSSVSQAVYTLIWAGYTPKWLDEFKDIPRHATRSSGVTRTVLPISGSN